MKAKYQKTERINTYMNIKTRYEELIGKTPLYSIKRYQKAFNLQAEILAKLEFFNPAGSIKDRAALYMLNDAEKSGKIKEGATIIEATSGNTGIGLAAVAASRGYKVILTMPETMSTERRKLLSAYGAKLVLTDGKKGMNGSVEKALELANQIEGSFIPDQFANGSNADAHYNTTAPEIYEDTDGKVDILVAGVGTGGTISGIGRYLKEKNKNVKIVAVEPDSSPLLSKGYSGSHGLQGIGANFVPEILDKTVIDEIITVTEKQAYDAANALVENEGLLVGISSGAALFAATEIAGRSENIGKKIVVILTDGGDRYLSTPLFDKN